MHLIESNYSTFESPELTYSSAYNNLTAAQFSMGKYAEALSTIQKHRSLFHKSESAKAHVFIYSYLNETNYYLVTSQFEKGAAIIKDIEKELDKFKSGVPGTALFSLCGNIANLYFGAGEYRQSLVWVNKIINHPKVMFREDVQASLRILQILIHYELNTPDILEHLIVSAYRFLHKRERLYKVEEGLLNFLRRLNKINASQTTQVKEFRTFRDELVQITKGPEEKKALLYFDLISWLESKIENRPFAEIVREKFLREGKKITR